MIYFLAVRLWKGRAESKMRGFESTDELWLELPLPDDDESQGEGEPSFDHGRALWFRLGRTVDSL
jgi:hypothetical protein